MAERKRALVSNTRGHVNLLMEAPPIRRYLKVTPKKRRPNAPSRPDGLEALIRSGPIAFAPNPPSKRDRYGRLLVQLLVNGEDAACILIREGYARPWRGRREDWCTEVSLAQPEVTEAEACASTSSVR